MNDISSVKDTRPFWRRLFGIVKKGDILVKRESVIWSGATSTVSAGEYVAICKKCGATAKRIDAFKAYGDSFHLLERFIEPTLFCSQCNQQEKIIVNTPIADTNKFKFIFKNIPW